MLLEAFVPTDLLDVRKHVCARDDPVITGVHAAWLPL
jgi:hypothetical protein